MKDIRIRKIDDKGRIQLPKIITNEFKYFKTGSLVEVTFDSETKQIIIKGNE